MAHDHVYLLGDELGAHVCRNLGLALVVLLKDNHLLAHHAAPGVDVVHHELGCVRRRQTVRGQITAVRPGHPELDGILSHCSP